jgi:hypothetical protein
MRIGLALVCLAAATTGWSATEYDQFIASNASSSYPTITTLLSIEEGAVNKVLRREFAKSFHFHVGDQNLSGTVRVGNVLEGNFTASVTGFNDFSFGIREIGIDLQKAPGDAAGSLVARVAFDLNIGGAFVRSYTFDWTLKGTFKPVLLLDQDMMLDLAQDLDDLAGHISYDDVCNALQSHSSTDCNEALGIVRGKLKQSMHYLPIGPNVRAYLANLSRYRDIISDYYANNGFCHTFAQDNFTCPEPVAQAESQAKNYFMAIATALESSGFRSDLPEIAGWKQSLKASRDWLNACSSDNSNPLKSECGKLVFMLQLIGNYGIPERTYDQMVAFQGSVMGLLAPNGRRIEGLPASISNGSLYVMFDKDRFVVYVNYDFKAETPTLAQSYDAPSGILTLTSNAAFSIISINPVDAWSASNLEIDPDQAMYSRLSLDPTTGVYTIQVDLRKGLLWGYQYKWWQNKFCPSIGCPPPDYSNMAGRTATLTVTTSVAGAPSNSSSYPVKL